MDKYFIVTYLIDGLKFGVIIPYRQDVPENELLSFANKEVEENGYQEYELLDWRVAEKV